MCILQYLDVLFIEQGYFLLLNVYPFWYYRKLASIYHFMIGWIKETINPDVYEL